MEIGAPLSSKDLSVSARPQSVHSMHKSTISKRARCNVYQRPSSKHRRRHLTMLPYLFRLFLRHNGCLISHQGKTHVVELLKTGIGSGYLLRVLLAVCRQRKSTDRGTEGDDRAFQLQAPSLIHHSSLCRVLR